KILLSVVSERTGYPAEMIKLDQDIEADLGIDAIRRVEIIEVLSGRLPPAAHACCVDRFETLSRAKTLATMLALLDPPLAARAEPDAPPPRSTMPTAGPMTDECPRFVMQARMEPAPRPVQKLEGLFLVTPDQEIG